MKHRIHIHELKLQSWRAEGDTHTPGSLWGILYTWKQQWVIITPRAGGKTQLS